MLCRKNILFYCLLLASCTAHAQGALKAGRLFFPTFLFRYCRPETTRLINLNRPKMAPRLTVLQQYAWPNQKASPTKKLKWGELVHDYFDDER